MTETHESHESHGQSGHGMRPYLVVGLALAIFTIVSFVVNGLVTKSPQDVRLLTPMMGFFIIVAVAVVKATLVGIYFMHLNHDWGRVGFLIIPAFILGVMMMFVLLPDIVLGWHNEIAEYSDSSSTTQK